jgi:hypothetical protein
MADTVPSAAQMKQALALLHVMGVLQAVGDITGPADDTPQTTGQSSFLHAVAGAAPAAAPAADTDQTTVHSSFLHAVGTAPVADTPQPTGQSSREDKAAKIKSHISANAPTFQGGKGYSGGNPNSSVNPMRVIEVEKNKDGCAMFWPNKRYSRIIQTIRDTVEAQGRNIENEGIVHPYLGFRKATINEKVWKELANKILPNSGDDTKRARQFRSIVCYLGISSHSMSGLFEWTFDPERWNREGYRITRGGDVKGGKPQVDFKP